MKMKKKKIDVLMLENIAKNVKGLYVVKINKEEHVLVDYQKKFMI